MKSVNILSLVQASKSLNVNNFKKFEQYYNIKFKPHELNDLDKLVNELRETALSIIHFEDFYVGYKIPQIGKEFDLLRIGDNFVVNIELKQSGTTDKIQSQLIKNKYYLKFLKKKVYHFTFVSALPLVY